MQIELPQVVDYAALATKIKEWAKALGFQAVGIADTDLHDAEENLRQWLAQGFHGEMDYMVKHGVKRSRPADLIPGTLRVISVRMDYSPPAAKDSWQVLEDGSRAFISRYALGRDYHKVLRNRLEQLAQKIRAGVEKTSYRVFTDSAPVMEVELARKARLGWRGKHTLLLSREHGSWFFLGEIYTDLPLPVEEPQAEHCGTCTACIKVCPTQAIVAPYKLDARRCISYLTIELKGSIPLEFRPLIGNRIYGCDDCQLVCPWNKFAHKSLEADFAVRNGLDDVSLVELFSWDEKTFKQKFSGSAVYRIGYEQWLRNIAVALGNAPRSAEVLSALNARAQDPSPLVREHVKWALECGSLLPLCIGGGLPPLTEQEPAPAIKSGSEPPFESGSKLPQRHSGGKPPHSKAHSKTHSKWPHAPTHCLTDTGIYMVTAATYRKQPLFRDESTLRMLHDALLTIADKHSWRLEAWAIFPNHYHFIAAAPKDANTLTLFIRELHSRTAIALNRHDAKPNRKVWQNFWETQLTHEASYLARLNYVHQNPVKHGIVSVAADYPWCSAAWFERTATPAQVKTIYSFKTDHVSVQDAF